MVILRRHAEGDIGARLALFVAHRTPSQFVFSGCFRLCCLMPIQRACECGTTIGLIASAPACDEPSESLITHRYGSRPGRKAAALGVGGWRISLVVGGLRAM